MGEGEEAGEGFVDREVCSGVVFRDRVPSSREVYPESVFEVKLARRWFGGPMNGSIGWESGRGRVDEGVDTNDS
jgi:hypothetical protein